MYPATRESVIGFYFVLCSNPLIHPTSLHRLYLFCFRMTWELMFADESSGSVSQVQGKSPLFWLFSNNLLCEASSRRAGFQLPLSMNCTGSLVWLVVEENLCWQKAWEVTLEVVGKKVLRNPVPAMLHIRILVVPAEYLLCVSGKRDRHISAFKGLEVSWRSWKL